MSKPERPYRKRTLGNRALKPETLMMSYGFDPHLSEGAVKPPIFATSTFAFRSAEHGAAYFRMITGQTKAGDTEDVGLAYSRFNNPDLEVLEDRLTLFDGAEQALAFSSGMGAITTSLLACLDAGTVIVHATPLYGATETFVRNVLPRFGVKSVEFAASATEKEIRAAVDEGARLGEVRVIYTETPANPTNDLVDLDACARVRDSFAEASGYRPVLMTDNTMMGPIGLSPIEHGVDLVLYSLTKYIGGHSDLIAGGAVGSTELITKIQKVRASLGTNPDPHTCWLLMRSLETVKLRMERSFDSAKSCAEFLRDHPKVDRVRYLGFTEPGSRQHEIYTRTCKAAGSTFAFDIAGGREAAFRFVDALTLVKLAVSLGGTETLICHPGSTTHFAIGEALQEQLGFAPGMVRISIGVEHPDDLIADLDQALAHA